MSKKLRELKTVSLRCRLDHSTQTLPDGDQDQFIIKGYASVFDIVDSHNDRVIRGAFREGLQNGHMPKLLWQHQDDQVIGAWTHIQEDDHGLYVEGRLIEDIQKAREAKALIAAGAIDGLSIGYYVKTAIKGKHNSSTRLLTAVDLIEVSLVTFPSNSASRVIV